jgi:Asp-tRNA(Asn)/Glu-tRNA(Gln) amidotransferase A subunit family amidase
MNDFQLCYLPATEALRLFRSHVLSPVELLIATATDPAVERLLRAGAIVHARTTTPEFCSAWITHTRLHGTTSTPWNPKYTSSGSSGGSGASLAAGFYRQPCACFGHHQ